MGEIQTTRERRAAAEKHRHITVKVSTCPSAQANVSLLRKLAHPVETYHTWSLSTPPTNH